MAIDPELRDELLALERRDETARRRLAAGGALFDGYDPEMERVHLANARRLAEILDRVGWPGRSLAGEAGAGAAWLVAHHAISWPRFQRRCRELLEAAVAAGDAPAWQLAYLTDRIRFNERRPQVYGTIYDWDEQGSLSPWPCEDPGKVDELRAGVGLPPLAENTGELRRRAAQEGDAPPADHHARQAEIDRWARRTGWI